MSFHALFIVTQLPGVNYYRCASFANNMGSKATIWPECPPDKYPNWQEAIEGDRKILYALEKEAAKADSIVCQRIRTGFALSVLMALKSKLGKKILVEIDDDAFNVDASNPGFSSVNPGSEAEYWFRKQLEMSDGVIVSTEHLKTIYEKTNKNIYVVPNSIDFTVWDRLKKKKHKGIRIGWQGSLHHYRDIQILLPVIPKILKQYKEVEFHFFGAEFDFLKIDRCVSHPMLPIDKYPKKMAELNFDIILAPLEDTFFNRGKSNLRVLEAGALAKAVVATGNKNLPYANVIESGKSGLLCNSSEDWFAGVSFLLANKKLRLDLGVNLYAKVKRDFNIKDTAKRYEGLLKKIK